MNPANSHCELLFLLDPVEATSEGFCAGFSTLRTLWTPRTQFFSNRDTPIRAVPFYGASKERKREF